MFEKEKFVDECKMALADKNARSTIRSIVEEAVASPKEILTNLGVPEQAGLNTIYHSNELTILNIVWGPEMNLHPHNHGMWAVIGIYGGKENNTFYRRSPEGLKIFGMKSLEEKDVAPLGEDVIHSVENPMNKLTAAIHVYGGDFFEAERSEWDFSLKEERPFDIEHTRKVFEESNRRIYDMGLNVKS